MRLVLVYNSKSGNAVAKETLLHLFTERNITIDTLVEVGAGFELKLKEHIKNNAYIAVVGGDGTLSTVANLMVGTEAVLVPLPGGTLNHFTKDLGIPQDLADAVLELTKAHIIKVDVASVNGTVFLNNSSIGIYPSSLLVRDKFEPIFGKWPAAVIASLRAVIRLRGYTVLLQNKVFRTPFVFIGNNEYRLDMVGAPVRALMDKGVLSLFIAKKVSRVALVKIACLSFIGRAHLATDFETCTTKAVTIKSLRRSLNVSHDGEVSRMRTPLHYKVRSKALRVLC
jgi:diacylglycerol kinase family enzyme